ncbi:helix-turn-helix transcriptional regulator [Pedobacter panaciterrae]|uniref:helix-turn-helix domain-containing protein n=1 Tax=Pedobacter panaciterrae TaxID=363849 RepID=UPI00155DB95D|nr:helix-turn-helix transcriptional regulator [Pedobacter panaciterrae]NQX52269.1 helix-turn-helix transcriptional regulator [Pedobacter panaciterrae]
MDIDDLDSLKDKLGKRIKELRAERGLGVRQFALMAEMEHPQLINIEKGRVDVKLATIYKIAKALKLHPKELFDIELRPPTE